MSLIKNKNTITEKKLNARDSTQKSKAIGIK